MVLVEPGTPDGFGVIDQARALVLEEGGAIVAPCTHGNHCPLSQTDSWCHFSQFVERSPWHKLIKNTSLAYEHEKFSFIIFAKAPKEYNQEEKRIISAPIKRSGHVLLDVCTKDGLTRETVSQKDKQCYKKAKKVAWGDVWNK